MTFSSLSFDLFLLTIVPWLTNTIYFLCPFFILASDEIPKLSEKKEYTFKFELVNSLSNSDVTFPMCMICAMVIRNDGLHATMGCSVKDSKDGINHFWMLEKDI